MLTTMSTKEQATDEIEAFVAEKRRQRGTAQPRSTAEMIDAIITIYNRELDALAKTSVRQDLTPEQHDTLRVVTSSTIALHRALTVQVPDPDAGVDLSKASMKDLRAAAAK